MKTVACLSDEDRSDLFRNTASRMQMSDAIVEKDFWVCFIPNGPGAEYCDETECQRAQKRKNRRGYVERKKAQTITSRTAPGKRK